MNANTQKRLDEITARREAIEKAKVNKNYCDSWSAMHTFSAAALADVDFLLNLVKELRKP